MPVAATRVRSLASDAASLVRNFLSWWGSELRHVYEEVAHQRRRRAALIIGADEITLTLVRKGVKERSTQIPRPPKPEDVPKAVERLIRQSAALPAYVDVTMAADAVLGRQITLPSAAGRRLREAVGYQLDRLSPLKPELIYFDCALVGEDRERRRLIVEFTIARRRVVDALADAILSTSVRSVRVAGPSTFADRPGPVFLRKSRADGWRLKKIDQTLLYVAGALAILSGLTCFIQWHRENGRLEQQIAAMRITASAAAALREKVDSRIKERGLLSNSSTDHAAVLAELTRLLPADVWLFQYQCEGATLQLSGFASNASKVSAALAKSSMFASVALRSSIKAPGTDSERFDLTIQLKARTP